MAIPLHKTGTTCPSEHTLCSAVRWFGAAARGATSLASFWFQVSCKRFSLPKARDGARHADYNDIHMAAAAPVPDVGA